MSTTMDTEMEGLFSPYTYFNYIFLMFFFHMLFLGCIIPSAACEVLLLSACAKFMPWWSHIWVFPRVSIFSSQNIDAETHKKGTNDMHGNYSKYMLNYKKSTELW